MAETLDQTGEPQPADETAANLQAILDTVVDAVVTIDEQGVIRQANRATTRMFGFQEDELIGQNVSLLMPAPYREEHDGYLRNYLQTGEAKIIGIGREVVARRKDGTLFPVDLAVSEVNFGDTRLFTGVLRDMTDRRQTEEQLQHERTFSDSLLKTANAIVLVLDEQGRIVRFNDYLEHLSGYTLEEVRGRDWFTTFIPERDRERIRRLFHETVAGTPVHSHVNPILTRSGQERIIAWSGRRIVEADEVGRGVLAIGADITELKTAEQKLIQAERLAAIGQMVTGLAHESRNALQRTRACLEMLGLDLENQPELMDLTRRATEALDELQRLYEEVRNYAAPLKLEHSACNLADLWSQTWEHLASVHAARGVRLRTECRAASLECRVDRSRMQQVFRNVLENALAVAPEGSEIAVTCRDGLRNGRRVVEVTVADEGPGLDCDQSARIFEPFYTTKTKGTGLGMAIAKRIVEAHGGTIEIGDSTGRGAEIVISLPR